jgi:hypothetical protein
MAEELRAAGIKFLRHLRSVTTRSPQESHNAIQVINWVWSAQNNFQNVQNLFTISHNVSSIKTCSFLLFIFAVLLEMVYGKILDLFPVLTCVLT